MHTEQRLAIDFIRAGITPFFLEQSRKHDIRKIVLARGFEPEDLQAIIGRWDIEGARKRLIAEKRRPYDRQLWAKKKEQTK